MGTKKVFFFLMRSKKTLFAQNIPHAFMLFVISAPGRRGRLCPKDRQTDPGS
jgi:hypothetical protein